MEWFRFYCGTFNDPKLQWVARRACQPVASVVAVWVAVLERASSSEVRGCCEGLDFESLDIALGLDDGSVHDIYHALVAKEMIVDGDMVAAWEKRQPIREDNSTDRVREFRQRDKLKKQNEELRQQLEAVSVKQGNECNDVKRTVTQGNDREEEKREEKNKNLKTHQQHAGACEQLAEVVESRAVDLQRLFPEADIPVVAEKLLHHHRDKPRLLDPWATALKWFQREFKAVALLPVAARASPKSFPEQWRETAEKEMKSFIYGGNHDADYESDRRENSVCSGDAAALQGSHAAGG